MTKRIKYNNTYIGLDSKVFSLRPINKSDFKNSMEIKFDVTPENIFEEIRTIFKALTQSIEKIQEKSKTNLERGV